MGLIANNSDVVGGVCEKMYFMWQMSKVSYDLFSRVFTKMKNRVLLTTFVAVCWFLFLLFQFTLPQFILLSPDYIKVIHLGFAIILVYLLPIKFLIPFVAGCWSLFQLALPKFILLNSEYTRSIHLGFAIFLAYLSFPLVKNSFLVEKLKKAPKFLQFLYVKEPGFLRLFLAIVASACALYLFFDYIGIGERSGIPNTRDIIIGSSLIVLLLEAARRSLGPSLPIIATAFLIYSFFSEHMPEVIAFKNATLAKVISKTVMGSEGIYGIPLDVSASTVFLFVLFGTMLEKSGGGQYFIQIAFSLLGRFRGGPAKAAVLASGLTGMVSGSSIANTVTTGTFTIPLMKKVGFPGYKAAAVEVAASTNGQLMPPIMGAAAFIIAEYCNISYFEVLKAAIIPAFVSYIALIYIVDLEAKKMKLRPVPKEELPKFWPTFLSGVHFFIPLGFLIYQLIILRRSASLSAYYAIVALMALILVRNFIVGYQKNKQMTSSIYQSLKQIWETLVAGAHNMTSISVAVATAGIIVGIVTLGLGGVVTEVIDLVASGHLMPMLLITAGVSLLLGLGLPTTANYIVMASLTAPAMVALSGDLGLVVPLIAAHLFCFYFGILADDTPPVGLAAYAAAAIARENPIKVGIQSFKYDMRTAILPFMFIFNTEILLVGVDSIWYGSFIFITTLIAMFAFVSFIQGIFFVTCTWYERIALILPTLILFRPDLFIDLHQDWNINIWRVIGMLLFFGIYAFQRLRVLTYSR